MLRKWGVGTLAVSILLARGAGLAHAALCDGHGICQKYTVHKGDPIQVQVSVDSVPLDAGVTNDLGYRYVGDVISLRVSATDPDEHVCDIPQKPVLNYIQPTDVKVRIVVQETGQALETKTLTNGPAQPPQTIRVWQERWKIPETAAGYTLVFQFQGVVDDVKCSAKKHDASDDTAVDLAAYCALVRMPKVEIVEGTDRYAPVTEQGGRNALVAQGWPEGGNYYWTVSGVSGTIKDANSPSTWFEGATYGDGTAEVQYTIGGTVCKASVDIHVWIVEKLEFVEEGPAASTGLQGTNQKAAKDKDKIRKVFMCLDAGPKELRAVLKGIVADGLPPDVFTVLDHWTTDPAQGASVTLQVVGKEGGAKVLVTPVKPGTTTIEYRASDKEAPGPPDLQRQETIRPPVKIEVTVLKVELDHDLWWFNGENPGGGYHIAATLTVQGVTTGTFKWDVIAGATKVDLNNGGADSDSITATDDNNVTVKSTGASSSMGDVTIALTYNGTAVCSYNLTVRKPGAPELVSGYPVDQAWGPGFKTTYYFKLLDQFGQEVPFNLPFNESFGVWTNDCFNTWLDPHPSGGVTTNRHFHDYYQMLLGGIPLALNPGETGSNDPVKHARQFYRIGSSVPGNGVLIKQHTVQFYRGRGRQL